MATAPKSNASAMAIWSASRDVKEGRTLPVPKHLKDTHYKGAKSLGHGKGYRYSHDFPGGIVEQDYLGVDKIYYDPTDRGYEADIRRRLWMDVVASRRIEKPTSKTAHLLPERCWPLRQGIDNMTESSDKSEVRRQLRDKLMAMSEADRDSKSLAAAALMAASPEFSAAGVVMLYLSSPHEVDTAPLALRCWQSGKTVVVPKVSWNQRRMLPVEITSLQTSMTTIGPGVREPVSGKPIPINLIDLVIVPGLGFTQRGPSHRSRHGLLRSLSGAAGIHRPVLRPGV